MRPMAVVAAAVISDGRLLVVSKRAAPDVFYLPGGKPDRDDEPEPETLARELYEELLVQPIEPLPYLVVDATAAIEGVPMRLSVYRCALSAPPRRAAEIAAIGWTDGGDGYRLAPAIRDVVVPRLLTDGLLT